MAKTEVPKHEFYVCSSCGNRIHRSRVPNSISGDVECCGRNMRRPYDPVANAIFTGAAAVIVAGTLLLRNLAHWGLWSAIGLSAGVTLLVLCPAAVHFLAWREKRRPRQ